LTPVPNYETEPLALDHKWDYNVPDPLVIAFGNHTYIIARSDDHGPVPGIFVIIRFESCEAFYYGVPDEESGMQAAIFGATGPAVEIRNSKLVEEVIRRQDELFRYLIAQHPSKYLERFKHFVLFFADQTVECVARRVSTELYHGSRAEAINRLAISVRALEPLPLPPKRRSETGA